MTDANRECAYRLYARMPEATEKTPRGHNNTVYASSRPYHGLVLKYVKHKLTIQLNTAIRYLQEHLLAACHLQSRPDPSTSQLTYRDLSPVINQYPSPTPSRMKPGLHQNELVGTVYHYRLLDPKHGGLHSQKSGTTLGTDNYINKLLSYQHSPANIRADRGQVVKWSPSGQAMSSSP